MIEREPRSKCEKMLVDWIRKQLEKNFTGQIRINCHKGDISEKIEVKQTHHLKGEGENNE